MRLLTKIGLLFILAGASILTFCLASMPTEPVKLSVVEESRSVPLNSTCKISVGGGGTGTGVTLNTGYVITAGHVVDNNKNDRIDKDEKTVTLIYYGDIARVITGTVVYLSKDIDLALIEPSEKLVTRGVRSAKNKAKTGERIYTIGCTVAENPIMSDGYIGEKSGKINRASCFISTGNSGGGIFKSSNNELDGIVRTVRTTSQQLCMRAVIPMRGGMSLIHAHPSFRREVNGLAGFLSMSEIRSDLRIKNLLPLIDIPPESKFLDNHVNVAIIQSVFQALLVIMAAYAARKYLFPA